jgi:hypothetical protein
MKLKLISRMAGPDGNFPPGSVLALDEKTGIALVAGGYAESLEPMKDGEQNGNVLRDNRGKPGTRKKG